MGDLVKQPYCLQCRRFVYNEEKSHLNSNPDHVLITVIMKKSRFLSIGNSLIETELNYVDSEGNVKNLIQEINRNKKTTHITFNKEGSGYTTSSETYETVAKVVFKGTAVEGIPSQVNIIAEVDPERVGYFRIYDYNNSTTICETSFNKDLNYQTISMTDISNLPTGDAILEIQLKINNNNGNKKVNLQTVSINY